MPPKGKRPAAPEEPFLFINEDFSTLFGGSKNAEIDRSKQSHVQRQSFAKRRKPPRSGNTSISPSPSEGAQSPLPDPTGRGFYFPFPASESLWLSTTSIIPDGEAEAAEAQNLAQLAQSEPPRWQSSYSGWIDSANYDAAMPDVARSQELSIGSISHPSFPSAIRPVPTAHQPGSENILRPQPSPDASSLDPFHNTQKALELWAPSLMRHFTLIMIPEIFYTDMRSTSIENMRHIEDLHEDMRSCMRDPAELYSLLAASACHWMGREGYLSLPGLDPTDSDRVILLFKSKAYEALRNKLASGTVSQGTVLATQRMVCIALYANNIAAAKAHDWASRSMIEQLGGLEAFNDFQKERLIYHEMYYALTNRSTPRLELTWDPGSFPRDIGFEEFKSTNSQRTFGSRIQALTAAEVSIYSTVEQVIPELVEAQQVLEWLRTQPYRPAEYQWLAYRRLATIQRLLTHDTERPSLISRSNTGQNVVRLALLYFLGLMRALPYSDSMVFDRYVADHLKLGSTDAAEKALGAPTDMLLWMITLFGIGATPKDGGREGGSEGGTDHAEILNPLSGAGSSACSALGIETEPELRVLLRSFLFDDEIVDDRYWLFVENDLGLRKE